MDVLFVIGAFCALPYIVYASVQTVRGQMSVGRVGSILAYLGLIIPLAVLALNNVIDEPVPVLSAAVLANAVIVLVIGVVITVIDFRRSRAQITQSPGVLGIGISLMLIVGVVITPIIVSVVLGNEPAVQAASDPVSGFVGDPASISDFAAIALPDTNTANGQAVLPNTSAQTEVTELQIILESETGLAVETILEQIQAGTTITAMIEENNGDITVVSNAITTAFEQAVADGTVPQQMLSAFGGDVAGLTEQLITGQLPSQIVPLMLSNLLGLPMDTSNLPAGGFPGGGEGGMPSGATLPGGNASDAGSANPQPGLSSTEVVIAVSPEPAQVELTPFVFPTMAVVDIAELAATTPSPAASSTAGTSVNGEGCFITVDFNLNMRVDPNPESDWVLTIPFGSVVSTSGPDENNWWFVTYEDQSGWVSGDYVTPGHTCAGLVTAS